MLVSQYVYYRKTPSFEGAFAVTWGQVEGGGGRRRGGGQWCCGRVTMVDEEVADGAVTEMEGAQLCSLVWVFSFSFFFFLSDE